MLIEHFILRISTGRAICRFAERMGVVYVKMAQILAMQNYGNLFTEEDRVALSKICDDCKAVPFRKIRRIVEQEYGMKLEEKFQEFDEAPLGAASISQVHRAVLLDGREVAIKIKRQDIAKRVKHDTEQIKRIIRRFGRLAKFRNFIGSQTAMELWASWIFEETDFLHERTNILRYQKFETSVNGKIDNTIKMVAPEVYEEFCTDNIIVMELIKAPTLNHIELNRENRERITSSINDYLSLSFYAMFHDMPVIFHGDPHSGNIYLDEAGNIGFLDMGLIFELEPEENKFARKLFLLAYSGRGTELAKILLEKSNQNGKVDGDALARDIMEEVKKVQNIPVAQFFVEMINIFTRYNLSPPIVFFKMAKAFLAIFGINNFIGSLSDTKELLLSQITEFYLQEMFDEAKNILTGGLEVLPNLMKDSLEGGLVRGLSKQLRPICELQKKFTNLTENFRGLAGILEI